ncbi:HNH endonuclease family protein [Dietzia sp. SYD-A1]|uniref:HNH endonuclease family protein n=1 Tax=Dietzia sp. SYD-A1 TaxID=2780141 RepID=UPI001891313B|nr:HNH endonuclease family protein [Dietzia sp. SYD-A1]
MTDHHPIRPRPGGHGRIIPPLGVRALGLTMAVAASLCVVLWWAEPRHSAPGSPGRQALEALLTHVDVVPERITVPGYERDCSGASACVFGPAWSDSTGAPYSGNGCSTRHDVLARDLGGTTADPASGCSVDGGTLVDPYTGRVMDVSASGLRGIHVDHVFPLSAAWDLGAWDWSPGRRAAFANDVERNLLAVTGSVNSRKSDWTPEDWLPPDPGRHCFYAARYLTAAVAYGLPVTAGDREALAAAVRRCPRGG